MSSAIKDISSAPGLGGIGRTRGALDQPRYVQLVEEPIRTLRVKSEEKYSDHMDYPITAGMYERRNEHEIFA